MLQSKRRQKQDMAVAYENFGKSLNSYAFFKVHNQALGEDLVQETFAKTWSYLAKGGKVDVMKAFLYHILNNLIVDEYRKHKPVSLDSMVEKGFELKTSSPRRLLDRLDGKAAMMLIKSLPPKYQKVMHQRYVKDLSIGEIATLNGQTKNAVAVQLHRGLAKLKTLYTHE